MIKIIASVVFILFGFLAAQALNSLFGHWSVLFALFVTAGLMWEIWGQPIRDEKYRQELLAEIEGLKFVEVSKIHNVTDARDVIDGLQERLECVSSAYVELKKASIAQWAEEK